MEDDIQPANTVNVMEQQRDLIPPTPIKLPELLNKTKDEVDKLNESSVKLEDIQKKLDALIDILLNNQSLFTRASLYWSEIPLWQRIIAGTVVIVPLFVLGIAVNLAVLLSISLFTLITYTAGSLLLDNHHSHNKEATKQLKIEIGSLAGILVTVIDSLGKLKDQLKEAIDAFAKENELLAKNVTLLSKQVTGLTQQTEQLQETLLGLRAIKEELELTGASLANSVEEQSQLLEATTQQLLETQTTYDESQKQLSVKITELHTLKTEMESKVEKLRLFSNVLQGTVTTLSDTIIANKDQREIFHKRLDDFLTNKEASFHLVAERICDAEKELVLVKEELKRCNNRHHELLDRQEQQVVRLEELVEQQLAEDSTVTDSAKFLPITGFFATELSANSPKHDASLLVQQEVLAV